MGQFSTGVFINRPQQVVFDFLSDPANLSRWNSSFDSARWTSSDPPAAGSSYAVVARIFGSRKEGLFDIVDWERPRRYAYRSRRRVYPIEHMETAVTLDPRGGGTQVTMDGQFALVAPLRFAEGALERLAAKQDGGNLAVARRLLESDGRSSRSGFEMGIVIDRPVAEVFAVLSDLDNDPKWRREWVDGMKTSEGPVGVGSTFRLIGQVLRWRTETEYEVTEYQPDHVVAWRNVTGPLPLTFWRRVEEAGAGTQVTIGYDAPLGRVTRLVGPLARSMGRRALAGDFPKLKQMLEARTL